MIINNNKVTLRQKQCIEIMIKQLQRLDLRPDYNKLTLLQASYLIKKLRKMLGYK